MQLECGCRFDAECIVALLRQHPACPVCLHDPHSTRREDGASLLAWILDNQLRGRTAATVARQRLLPAHRGSLSSMAFRNVVAAEVGRTLIVSSFRDRALFATDLRGDLPDEALTYEAVVPPEAPVEHAASTGAYVIEAIMFSEAPVDEVALAGAYLGALTALSETD